MTEAKSGAADTHPVYKSDAEQLSNAMDWFRGEYRGMNGVPLLIHPTSRFDKKAAVPTGCRVVTTERLAGLAEALGRYGSALGNQDAFRDAKRVARLLSSLGLTEGDFLTRYTVAARKGS